MLEAGRNLDSEIAVKVMGWTVELIVNSPWEAFEEWRDDKGWRYGSTPPSYSSVIAHAWMVVEHLRNQDLGITMYAWQDGYTARVGLMGDSFAETAPLAICRAALAAVARSSAASEAQAETV